MVSLFSVLLCSCCSRPRPERKDGEPDETSRLIPVLIDPSPSSTSPHIDQQVVQERLGNIVRNTRGKMVNVTAPSNVQHQIWRNAVDVGPTIPPEHVNDSGGEVEADGNPEREANKVRLSFIFLSSSLIYVCNSRIFKSPSPSPSGNPSQAPPTDVFQLQGADVLSVSWGPAD
jgi:hypothetical protein